VIASAPFVHLAGDGGIEPATPGWPGLVSGGIFARRSRARQSGHEDVKRHARIRKPRRTRDGRIRLTIIDKGVKRQVELPGVIIGKALSYQIGVKPGDPVILISPASLGAGNRAAASQALRSGRLLSLRDVRVRLDPDVHRFSKMDARCWPTTRNSRAGLELRLANMFDAPAIRNKIAAIAGPDFEVSDWTTRQRAALPRRCNSKSSLTSWCCC